MYALSTVTPLPSRDAWLTCNPSVCVDSAHYANCFADKLEKTAELLDWRLITNGDSPSIISAHYSKDNTSLTLNFFSNGECSMHANVAGVELSNTCYMDSDSDNWLNVQTTIDTVKAILR